MTKQKTKQSVQSDGSDGEKMSETVENFLTTIYGRELDGNELRSALAIVEQEKANTRRSKQIVDSSGKVLDEVKFKRLVKRNTKLLNRIDGQGSVSLQAELTPAMMEGTMKTRVIPVDNNDYIVVAVPEYVEVHGEFKVFDAHMKSGIPLLIEGPKGIGKTLGLAKYAEKKRCPMIEFDCSEGTKKYDLQGTKTGTADGGIAFDLGFIPRIIECANQFGMAILVLEELNALTPAMQKLLNPLLDWRKGMFIPETGKTYKLNAGVKLGLFATTNPASYQASNDLNEDLQSRFSIWKWTYPNAKQERKAIQWKGIDTSIQKSIMLLAKNTRELNAKMQLSYALSTRDIQKFVDGYLSYEDESIEILRVCLDMNVLSFYDEGQEVDTVKSRIESTFGSNIFTSKTMEDIGQAQEDDDY